MYKQLFCVTFVALLLTGDCSELGDVSVDLVFDGDSCVAEEDRAGTCQLLSECQPLVLEIRQAGAPMPMHIRRKLQSLACGFQSNEPLVCCATPYTNPKPDTTWRPPITHGMGGGSGWETLAPNQNTPKPTGGTLTNVDNSIKPHSSSGPPDIRGHRNLILLPSDCGAMESDRIWGGNRTRLYEMPWMVLLSYESNRGTKLSCGGTLITKNYVLTAAHCVSFLGDRLTLTGVVLGEYDVRKDPDCERVDGELFCAPNVRNVSIEQVIAHPGYSPQNLYDDIALVKLAQPADFTLDSMKPICLPSTTELQAENLVDRNGVVAGWGATEDGLQSPVLLSVDLPIVSNKDCQDAYNGSPQIYDWQICAGGVQEKDSCGGDSGGPLMYPGRTKAGTRYVQRGIVSYGSKRCGLGGYPGVYTRISYYMDWILDNIGSSTNFE